MLSGSATQNFFTDFLGFFGQLGWEPPHSCERSPSSLFFEHPLFSFVLLAHPTLHGQVSAAEPLVSGTSELLAETKA